MSYCVNCGVELEKACKSCPLCDTPVINPREKVVSEEKLSYPEELVIPKSTRNRFLFFLFSLIILIPNLVAMIINSVFFDNPATKYVVGAFAVAWLWFVFPLMWKKAIPAVLVAIDAVGLMAYFWLFMIGGDDTGWVINVAFPMVIALWAIVNIFLFWLRKKRSGYAIAVAVLGAINVMTFVSEFATSTFFEKKLQLVVTLVMTACCISLMIFFIILDKSKRMKAWLEKKFFI